MAPGHLPDYTIIGLAVFFFILWWFLWFLHLVAILHASRRLYRPRTTTASPETPLPGVSILKPITGTDPNFFNNLETFFLMNYPLDKFELLFCVQENNDPAIPIIESLRMKNPQVLSSLFVGGETVGINPKINNMMPGYRNARFEHVMVSDAALRMLPQTLLDMVSYLGDGSQVGLVHQLPYVCFRDGFAGVLEMVYFGCQQARMYLLADFFGFDCLTGMSFIIRKDIVDEAGGLQAFGKYIAEDYFLAQMVLHKNWRISISSLPALQNSGTCSVRGYQERMIRWIRLRVHFMPHLIVIEPLQECMLLGLLSSWSVGLLFEWNSLVFFLVHLLVWFLLDYLLIKLVQGCHVRNSYSSGLEACNSSCRSSVGSSSKGDVTTTAKTKATAKTTSTKSQHLTGIMKMNSARGHKRTNSSPSLGVHFDSGGVSGGVSSHSVKTADSFHQNLCHAHATPTSSQPHASYRQHLSSRHHHRHRHVIGVPGREFPVPKFDFLIAWMFREWMVLYLFVKGISTNKITWRTGSYRLDWGGTATADDAGPKTIEDL